MTHPTLITAQPGLPFVDIVREFNAPAAAVFRAHTQADLYAQWLGPRRFQHGLPLLLGRDPRKLAIARDQTTFSCAAEALAGRVTAASNRVIRTDALLDQVIVEKTDSGQTLLECRVRETGA